MKPLQSLIFAHLGSTSIKLFSTKRPLFVPLLSFQSKPSVRASYFWEKLNDEEIIDYFFAKFSFIVFAYFYSDGIIGCN